MNNIEIQKLEELLKTVFDFTKKQFQKFIFNIFKSSSEDIDQICNQIKALRNSIKKCNICNRYNENTICNICLDTNRTKQLMLVGNSLDIDKFENIGLYKGKYFVFDQNISLKNEDFIVSSLLEKLIDILKDKNELILSLSPTIEGQFNMHYIKKFLKNKINFTNIFQLSTGIPLGSSVEYIDQDTLKESLLNKIKM